MRFLIARQLAKFVNFSSLSRRFAVASSSGDHIVLLGRQHELMRISGYEFARNAIRGVAAAKTAISEVITLFSEGRLKESREDMDVLARQGITADSATHVCVLKYCGKVKSLPDAKRVHSFIAESGLQSDVVLGNQLVSIYGHCGSLKQARNTFDKMKQRNLVSWNMMIGAYIQHAQRDDALSLFQEMLRREVKPDKITFISVLSACASPAALAEGEAIHNLIVDSKVKVDVVLANALISMYGRCGSPAHARVIFDHLLRRDLITWNSMIAAYARNGRAKDAIQLFEQMHADHVRQDKVTFISILNACTVLGCVETGKLLHALIVDSGFEKDTVVGTALLNMYAKCGRLDYASRIFETMSQRNVVSWTAMIAAYVQNGLNDKALGLFWKMGGERVNPNKVTFISVLEACSNLSVKEEGQLIHTLLINMGFVLDVVLKTGLISMYGSSGNLEDARVLFEKTAEKNVVLWNVMIGAYAQRGFNKECYHLFQEMYQNNLEPDAITFITVLKTCNGPSALTEGRMIHALISDRRLDLDVVVGTALVGMYGRCGSLDDACRMFEKMPEHNMITWNAMIAAFAQHGHGERALQLSHKMHREGVKLDKVSVLNILEACATLADLEEGKLIHDYILNSGVEIDNIVGNALINMYAKCGSLENARGVFDEMKLHNVVSWSAMIAAFAQHGCGKEALVFLQQMHEQGVKPDEITFVSVLSACSHAGLISEGHLYFDSMTRNHKIMPNIEHYMCMIDLLGRAGQLYEAEAVILRMPFPPNLGVWMTFLAACRIHGHLEHGECATEHVLEQGSQNTAPYVVLSNIYAALGRLDDSANIRKITMERGWKNEHWCSFEWETSFCEV